MRAFLVCLFVAVAFHACSADVIKDVIEKVKDGIEKVVHDKEDLEDDGINNKLYVKFAPWIFDPLRKNSYFAMPRSVIGLEDTKDEKWRLTEDTLKTEGVDLYCLNEDYRVCLLFDKKGSVAGIRLSISVADMKNSEDAPAKPCQRPNTILGVEVYSTTIFFVKQDVLKAGGREMTKETLTAPDGFFPDVGDKEGIRQIPIDEKDIATTPYTKQNCYGGMGRHYFYDMTPETECTYIDGFFALYDEKKGTLVGTGMLSFGTNVIPKGGRSWFEVLPARVIKKIAPTAPDCAVDFIKKYGTNVIHIYTTPRPWRIAC